MFTLFTIFGVLFLIVGAAISIGKLFELILIIGIVTIVIVGKFGIDSWYGIDQDVKIKNKDTSSQQASRINEDNEFYDDCEFCND